MIYIEMARDETHGGGAWAFLNCVWAPTRTKPTKKRKGRGWTYWSKILRIKKGDTVIHLRGLPPNARFVGYSLAAEDGFETSQRPPDPGEWGYAEKFYRSNLEEFTPFQQPINLDALFLSRHAQLEDYFDHNKKRGVDKANIFYVRQNGQLQCQNGAYLSDVDEDLLIALFGSGGPIASAEKGAQIISIETGSQLRTIRSRIGQEKFSKEIKKRYGGKCCFPGCSISDSRFLIAAHIARWSDNEKKRGEFDNGLCLCVFHDRAFEIGLFSLDLEFKVFINPNELDESSSACESLLPYRGLKVTLGTNVLSLDSLREHWARVKVKPPVSE